MPEVTETIVINRPVEEVFAFATDPDNVMLYNTNLVDYSGEPPKKGARAEGAVRVAGKKFSWTSEVIDYEENQRIVFRSIESPMSWTMTQSYEEHDGATRLTMHQDIGSLGSFFGKLADPLVTRMYSKDVRSNLEKLKELCEA